MIPSVKVTVGDFAVHINMLVEQSTAVLSDHVGVEQVTDTCQLAKSPKTDTNAKKKTKIYYLGDKTHNKFLYNKTN
jgi:hypothetical protein